MENDKIHEACGLFGIYMPEGNEAVNVASAAYYALYALQHRGQASCGIVVNDDGLMTAHKDLGLVNDVFTESVMRKLGQGYFALGHVLYGSGAFTRAEAQPLVANHVKGGLAVAHNGAITNAAVLREKLELEGAIFHSTSDTEVIMYEITRCRLTAPSIEMAVSGAMEVLDGAYSLVIMSPSKLIGARDPHGFRPLCIGTMGDGFVLASESCALDSIGATFLRDVEPGEIVVIDKDGLRSITTHCEKVPSKLCVFEYVYFARPDSVIDGSSVHEARLRAGAYLALEHPVQADVVIGAPDSGLDAALGYARQSGIPYGIGFIKNKYIGRTFIQPTQSDRENKVRIKLNAISSTVKGKRVVLVDDSIVRGTTCAHTIHILREAGATEVHMRVASAPYLYPCYYGTDVNSPEKLIAHGRSVEEVAKIIGVDSLGYLSMESINRFVPECKRGFCTACFDGNYPTSVPTCKEKSRYLTKKSESKKG
ncbi:MAG: amidophosphoribosyltransferase [Clostridia bacterium]|nr:amidophosphoribosyltransferase [Clostridia bacterium]